MATAHIGKLSKEVSTVITDELYELLADRARQFGCKPSDLLRESLYLTITGDTYSAHVAKDMAAALQSPHVKLAEKSGEKGGAL